MIYRYVYVYMSVAQDERRGASPSTPRSFKMKNNLSTEVYITSKRLAVTRRRLRRGRAGPTRFILAMVGVAVLVAARPAAIAAPAAGDPAGGMSGMGGMSDMADMDMNMDMSTMTMAASFAGIPANRLASGTSWQPDTSPMAGFHLMLGDWIAMVHYNVFLNFDHQSGPRGGHQVDSQNWAMLMATRSWSADELTFRGMFSLEPWTVTKRGYPLLFQTGEAYNGDALVDRQHPHDFFMELAAHYRHALGAQTALSLYIAPSGEPALGPTAFMHRASAMDDPASPITHHWLDSTHISFGVVTAGISRGQWQWEGSYFNGREPDEDRWDIEKPHLDSFSTRLSWNPAPAWSAQISYGYLASPEELHPEESEHRTTASISYTRPWSQGRVWATTVAWGRNLVSRENSDGFLLESDAQVSANYTIFGRWETVEKTGEELGLAAASRQYDISQLTLGLTRRILPGRPFQLAVGAAATWSWAPSSLDAIYGRHPLGYWVFLRLWPKAMSGPMGK